MDLWCTVTKAKTVKQHFFIVFPFVSKNKNNTFYLLESGYRND